MRLPILSGALLGGASASLVIRLFDMASAYGLTVVLARYLGLAAFGRYSFILSIITLLAIPTRFGLPALIMRETGKALAENDWGRIFDLKQWAYRRTLAISAPLILAGSAVLIAFPGMFGVDERLTVGIGLLLVALFPIASIRAAILRGMGEIVGSQLTLQVVRPVVQLALIGALWVLAMQGREPVPASPETAMSANVIGALLSWVVGAILLKRLLGRDTRDAVDTKFEVVGWRSSLIALGLANAMYILDGQLGVMLLGVIGQDRDVGLYRVAAQFAMVVAMGYVATNVPITSQIARLWARGEVAKVRRLVRRGSQLAALFALPLALTFILGGRWILEVTFGPEFGAAYIPLVILAVAQMVNSACGSASSLLNMTHHEKYNLASFTIAVMVNIALGVMLIPRFGVMGGAIASGASVIVRNLLLWGACLRLLDVNTAFWARLPPTAGTEKGVR